MLAPANYYFLHQELCFFCLFTTRKNVAQCTFKDGERPKYCKRKYVFVIWKNWHFKTTTCWKHYSIQYIHISTARVRGGDQSHALWLKKKTDGLLLYGAPNCSSTLSSGKWTSVTLSTPTCIFYTVFTFMHKLNSSKPSALQSLIGLAQFEQYQTTGRVQTIQWRSNYSDGRSSSSLLHRPQAHRRLFPCAAMWF